MPKPIIERIWGIARDNQEAGMVEQVFERDGRPRCRFCSGIMTEAEVNDGFVECRRDKLVVSKRMLDE